MAYFNEKRGRWCASKEINGKRKQRWFKTKAEAVRWAATQDAASWTKAETQAATVLSVSNRYLDDVQARMHERTYKDKAACCTRLVQALPHGATVDDVTPGFALEHFAAQRKERGASPANRDRKNLAAMWQWALKVRIVFGENPFTVCPRFPVDEHERHVPKVQEMEKVLATETGEVRAWLLTMLHTAARRSELFRLTWADVDLDARTVRLGSRKRKSGELHFAKVPMTDALHDELKALKVTARSVYVFCQEDGQPFTSRQALMRRVCRRAEVRYFSFHCIRHLSASMMHKAGVPLPTIQAILRHARATTTDRYLRDLVGVNAEIDHAFEAKPKGKVVEMKRASGGHPEGSF